MPTVLENAYCSSCAGTHKLCYPHEDTIYTNREYEYECPITKLRTRVRKKEWGEPSAHCPKEAVFIREVRS